jgi:hypothetical protein
VAAPARTPSTELQAELERCLGEHFGSSARVQELVRRPCAYRSSFALEELEVVLEGGRTLMLMFKDLSQDALSERAQKVKPLFLHDPLREIDAYRAFLAPAELGTATYYGAAVDPDRRRHWLFLENVQGAGLWQFGELETWKQAARWLALLHFKFAEKTEWRDRAEHLISYDAAYYEVWPRRAQAFAESTGSAQEVSRGALQWLAERYGQTVEHLTSLPTTFIHGEFYASNVLVDAGATRVCPIDWEIAAVGPGLVDVAALAAGKWTEKEQKELALAYHAELQDLGGSPPPTDEFLTALDWCRLHLAVRWVGWAPSWSPPREHRHDWLREALDLAEEVQI